MSNAEQHTPDEQHKQSDAGVERVHIEREPVPGHPGNIPVDGDMRPSADGNPSAGPVAGPVEQDVAPSAEPAVKPGTPPGTLSERDRSRGSS